MPALNTYRGLWQPNVSYYQNDEVSEAGTYYVLVGRVSLGQDPATNPSVWQANGSWNAGSSSTVLPSVDTSGVTDVANINTALQGANRVSLQLGGVYYVS